ncbi:MAG: NAD(P)/FAD-dependent oxidoreductase [Gemmatimonadaceae bacterium]
MTGPDRFDAIVVGGGFYGVRVALVLRAAGQTVLLVERERALLGRASLRNQARVHNGYHYPRSYLTSLRSRMNYARFLDEFEDCVVRTFPHYYAVARGMSKTTAQQFAEFCRRIGAPIAPAPAAVAKLFDTARVDAVFEVEECAFDAARLRARMERELAAAGVHVMLEAEATRLADDASAPGAMTVTIKHGGAERAASAGRVFNCTFSRLNQLLIESGAAAIPVKHEYTEMALIEPPPELNGAAVTVMDGPFFSMMPFPSTPYFTLSHVRYTPHFSWQDRPGQPRIDAEAFEKLPRSRFEHMVRDAARLLPVMRGARYVESLWEVKTVMPSSEQDDSRPILLRPSERFPQCFTVLGAKIDSVYDVEAALEGVIGSAVPAPV